MRGSALVLHKLALDVTAAQLQATTSLTPSPSVYENTVHDDHDDDNKVQLMTTSLQPEVWRVHAQMESLKATQ